nr:hypothetical protein [uncultured Carboxylicivirga sp.]
MKNNALTVILGISVYDRAKEAGHVQTLLTRYGCSIKTRLGLHEVNDEFCSQSGLILLELFGDPKEQERLEQKLKVIPGVEVQKMVFNTGM